MMTAKIRAITYYTILILSFAICFSNVKAIPLPSHRFWGTVTLAGTPAPNGTLVEATINNITYASTTTSDGKYGYVPPFYVPADDLDTPEIIEGGKDGDTIDFYVARTYATSWTFKSGNNTELNLTIAAPTAPLIEIISPTTENPIYTQSNQTIQIIFRYTELEPLNATLKIYNATYTVLLITNQTVIIPGTNKTVTANITIPETAPDGKYNLSITMFNIYNLSATATQTYAIIIDNTPPTISNPYQDPPGQVVQPGVTIEVDVGQNVTVRVNVTDLTSNVKTVILSYNISATEWTNITMQTTGNEYTATIPSSQLPIGTTVTYYITATDNTNNTAQTPTSGIYFQYYVIPEFTYTLAILITLLAFAAIIATTKRKEQKLLH